MHLSIASFPLPHAWLGLPDMGHLAGVVRTAYRAAFLDAMYDGRAKPLLIPYSLLGASIVPILWLAIPHTSRSWVYRTRWAILAFVIWFNVQVARTTSSTNFACAYATGLIATWGTIMTMNLLVWNRPQFDAARVIRVKVRKATAACPEEKEEAPNGHLSENGLRRRKADLDTVCPAKRCQKDIDKEEYQYIWQTFPEKGPFLERLGWALDLYCSFRGAGWNYSIASIPRPPIPSQIESSSPVAVTAIPRRTSSGYTIPLSETELLTSRLTSIVSCFLILDFLAVQMMKDPFFILGPDNPHPLPPHFTKSPLLLLLYRECMSLAGIWVTINGMFSLNDLAQYYFFKTYFPSRAAVWHYASTFGSLSEVLDRGLAGWWGAWWHQTFRLEFLGPTAYLLRNGYIKRRTPTADALGLFASFFQSGLMHAAGSFTSVPNTKPWRSMLFFLLQGLGIALQQRLALHLGRYTATMPRSVRRAGNVLFCLSWLFMTAPLFINDVASTGLWLYEPVPISPLRFMGFGRADDHWWRWDSHHWPKWYPAQSWWEIGIAL